MTRLTSLVLPAYNPGPAIERTWSRVQRFLAESRNPWEAVIVLDGCTDESEARLARLSRRGNHRVRVVSYATNRGKGYAVRTGLLAASGTVRLFTDIDLAYSFDDITRVADEVWNGSALAIASRTHAQSEVRMPVSLVGYVRRRQIQSGVFNFVARTLLPISTHDTQAGLKGMTAAVAESVVPELCCNGFGFDCELLTACARAGVAATEVPVCVSYDTSASTTGSRATLRMLRELWQIRRAWRNRSIAITASKSKPVPTPQLAVA